MSSRRRYSAKVTHGVSHEKPVNASPVSFGGSRSPHEWTIAASVASVLENHPPLSPEWVKELRERAKLTQPEFAEKLGGRVNKGMVSKWERGEDEPRGKNSKLLLAYARRQGVPTDERQGDDLDSSTMTVTEAERALLESFRRLPVRRQIRLVIDLGIEADKAASSQAPAAQTPEE